jgi:hypothetical protein
MSLFSRRIDGLATKLKNASYIELLELRTKQQIVLELLLAGTAQIKSNPLGVACMLHVVCA